MAQVPTNRSDQDSDATHIQDHNNVHAITNAVDDMDTVSVKATPTGADKILINDEAASGALKYATIASLTGVTDSDAVHTNVAGEIAGLTQKATPVATDKIMIEDVTGNVKKYAELGDLPFTATNKVAILVQEFIENQMTTTEGIGSGACYHPIDDRFIFSVGDSPNETPDGDIATDKMVWVHEADDPVNPSTWTIRERYEGVIDSDDEAIFTMFVDGAWYLCVWANTANSVTGYTLPNPTPGQTNTTSNIGAAAFTYTPINGVNSNNTESVRYSRSDDRLYFIANRGAGTDDNDNDRELWMSDAGWSTTSLPTLPSTTLTQVNTGNLVTRPEGSSPVPNAAGDMDFIGDNILVAVGVATNTTPTPDVDNRFVMAWIKDTDQTWTQRFSAATNHYPDRILAAVTTSNPVNEWCAVNWDRGYMFFGAESLSHVGHQIRFSVYEGASLRTAFAPPTSLPASVHETDMLVGDGSGGWQVIKGPINVAAFGADPTGATDSGPAFRAARDYGDTLLRPYTIYVPQGEYSFSTFETISVKDGETGASSNFDVALSLPAGARIVGQGGGHGRSGGDGDTDYAPTVLFWDSETAIEAMLLFYEATPDWRGGGAWQLHVTDNSTARNKVTYGIYCHGPNMMKFVDVSVSHIEATGGWGMWIDVVRNGGDTEDEPTQYGTLTLFEFWRCDNGLRIDGRNPDWRISQGSILRHNGSGPTAGKYGMYLATNKVSVDTVEVQFYETCVFTTNHSASLGKHMTFRNVHVEADTGAAANSYRACFEHVGTAGQDELPLYESCEVGNAGKYADLFIFNNVTGYRIKDFRIRDNDWMTSTDPKINATSSTGTVDGVAV